MGMQGNSDVVMNKLFKLLWAYRPSFEVSAGCVLVYRSSFGARYLLLRYPHGHWDFVKGHIERGENEQEALLREIEEETGISQVALSVVPGFRKDTFYFYRAKGSEYEKRVRVGKRGIFVFKRVIYFLVETTQSSVSISHEHTDSEWLSYEQALGRLTFARAKEILKGVGEKK